MSQFDFNVLNEGGIEELGKEIKQEEVIKGSKAKMALQLNFFLFQRNRALYSKVN